MELHFKDVLSSMFDDWLSISCDRQHMFFWRVFFAVVAVNVEFSYIHAMHISVRIQYLWCLVILVQVFTARLSRALLQRLVRSLVAKRYHILLLVYHNRVELKEQAS